MLGIAGSHNGGMCLLRGDQLVVAIQEERLVRQKRARIWGAQPSQALDYVLGYAGITPEDLSLVALCPQWHASHPDHRLRDHPALKNVESMLVSHHRGHAASAFALSGFPEAAVLVIDQTGSPVEDLWLAERLFVKTRGRWETTTLYKASGVDIEPIEKHLGDDIFDAPGLPRFRSLGGMYAACALLIFGNHTDAGKVMGLAPYGQPTIDPRSFFTIEDSGAFSFSDRLSHEYTHKNRWPESAEEYQNLAASVQVALEEAVFHLLDRLWELCPSENLCYSGGVALNGILNDKILRRTKFKRMFILPAAEDSGTAIGAAYLGAWRLTGENRLRTYRSDALGRPYSDQEITAAIQSTPEVREIEVRNLEDEVVELLCEGRTVGWFQGRSEFGPRALGQRSILCDPRDPGAKDRLNSRVKFREAFRPFAPVVLLEEAPAWFDLDGVDPYSPFMLRVCSVRPEQRDRVPGIVHVDGTGRLQTISAEDNGRYYELVKRFFAQTGVPMLLNTSFNVMGEPIIETPEQALTCLVKTGLDYCVLGDRLLTKK